MSDEIIKDTIPEEAKTPKVKKTKTKKGRRAVPVGEIHIQATFNNTIITVTDQAGAALVSGSAGANGFKGSKKGTAYAAGVAAEKVAEKAHKDYGVSSADVFVKGVGLGRDSSIRSVATAGIHIISITDKTPLPHGGVRPKGERKP